ncbi:MAG: metal-dependent hydrolase [Candidatus Nanohalobium sp.]
MGDFKEHVLFGFLTASVVSFFLKGWINLGPAEIALSVTMLVVGSVLPDIDHKKAYVHRAAKAFASIGSSIAVLLLFPFPIHINFVFGAASFLLVYTSISSMRIKHRGFTHSLSFCTIVMSLAVIGSVYLYASAVPGIAVGLGVFSHLLLDREFKLA